MVGSSYLPIEHPMLKVRFKVKVFSKIADEWQNDEF